MHAYFWDRTVSSTRHFPHSVGRRCDRKHSPVCVISPSVHFFGSIVNYASTWPSRPVANVSAKYSSAIYRRRINFAQKTTLSPVGTSHEPEQMRRKRGRLPPHPKSHYLSGADHGSTFEGPPRIAATIGRLEAHKVNEWGVQRPEGQLVYTSPDTQKVRSWE